MTYELPEGRIEKKALKSYFILIPEDIGSSI